MEFASRRSVVYGAKGMVATSQSLAAQAGLEILRDGGNAVDAAIAAAMALTVVEPCSNGMGGDAFAIVWNKGKMYGFNSSGKSPLRISSEAVRALGYETMPEFGPVSVTVPGIPGMWAHLQRRFGSKPLTRLARSAVDYAENGFPVSPVVSELWKAAAPRYEKMRDMPGTEEWFRTFTVDGRTPRSGEIFRFPHHAETLSCIAETGAEAFYRGELAEKISNYFERIGGFLRADDLAAFHTEEVQPISVNYRGRDIWELPPNGQGIVALMALNILKGFEFENRTDQRTLHLQMEAIKLAFADAMHFVTDPEHMGVKAEDLLDEDYAVQRRSLITDRAQIFTHGRPKGSGTVYLCTADSEGNMVSYIQSNYSGFGSGVVVPGTGISMQNRGSDFSLDPNHYNYLRGGKRTYHTIIPGFVTQNGAPVGPFGLMGGYMQPQGHVQVLMNMFDFGMNMQEALDAPRWQWEEQDRFLMEERFGQEKMDVLRDMGHTVVSSPNSRSFGRGQMIFRTGDGSYMGATEPRADGAVAAY